MNGRGYTLKCNAEGQHCTDKKSVEESVFVSVTVRKRNIFLLSEIAMDCLCLHKIMYLNQLLNYKDIQL